MCFTPELLGLHPSQSCVVFPDKQVDDGGVKFYRYNTDSLLVVSFTC